MKEVQLGRMVDEGPPGTRRGGVNNRCRPIKGYEHWIASHRL